jgi:hypothetical protein
VQSAKRIKVPGPAPLACLERLLHAACLTGPVHLAPPRGSEKPKPIMRRPYLPSDRPSL